MSTPEDMRGHGELVSDLGIVKKWLEIESGYAWGKFGSGGMDIDYETAELLRDGVVSGHWSNFIGTYWTRYFDFKKAHHLKATQALLKEAATTLAMTTCLRYAKGMPFEDANRASLAELAMIEPHVPEKLDIVLDDMSYRDTPMGILLPRLHERITDERGADLDIACEIADQMLCLEAELCLRFASKTNHSRFVFPTPGISSSADLSRWERALSNPQEMKRPQRS